MSTWTTAASDLRTLISDGPNDHYVYRKKCFGPCDGSNRSFKSFEPRRVTDFTTSVAPLQVYKGSTAVTVTTDYTTQGEFVLTTAPVDGDVITASYYYQWFVDAELVTFLTSAAEWIGSGPLYDNIPEGLRPAAKYYAAQEAMHKLAVRFAERMSEMYLLEDAPDPKVVGVADSFRKLAADYKAKSETLRKQFYSRQDQAEAPLFGNNWGSVPEITPSR